MKHIKVLICIVLLVTFILNISSCRNSNESTYTVSYESFVSDISNNNYTNTKIEFSAWNAMPYNKENMANKIYNFLSKNYVGTYKRTDMEKGFSYSRDEYITENGVQLLFRDDTQEFIGINLMNKEFFDTEPYLDEVENPEETAIVIAEKVAKKFVGNLDEYTRTVDEPNDSSREKDGKVYPFSYHRVNYVKKCQGFDTTDGIRITVTSKGNVCSVMMGSLGAFNDINITINKEDLNESVLNKARTSYKGVYDIIETKIKEQCLGYTPNGELCVVSDVSFCLEDSSGQQFYTLLEITTVIS